MLRGALQTYRLDIGTYPSSAEGLAALMDDDAGDCRNFRIDDGTVVDPGTYYLRVEGSQHFTAGPYTLRAVHIPEDVPGRPDPVADFADTGILEFMPGEPRRKVVNVRNRGNGASDRSTVRLYRSTNRVISPSDEFHDSESFDALDALASSEHIVRFNGAREAGNYYIGTCVRPGEDESDSDNNCSSARRVVVGDTPATAQPSRLPGATPCR